MIGLAALDFEQQAVLALFGHGNDQRLGALIPCVQIPVQRIALLRERAACHDLTDHKANVPARLVDVLHE